MVIDKLDKLNFYASLNPLFKDIVDFLKTNDLNALEEGKHFIKDKDLFVNIQVAKGRSAEGFTPLDDLPTEFEYNDEKDITKYGATKAATYVTCKPGEMAIFFPQDGHAPCISSEPAIKKAIFKIKA